MSEQFEIYASKMQLIVVTDKRHPRLIPTTGAGSGAGDAGAARPRPLRRYRLNCIQRRNLGLLAAYRQGAEVVAVVDDDNIPLPDWGQNVCLGKPVKVREYQVDVPAFDPVGATNYPHLWHRGFPLQLLRDRSYQKWVDKEVIPDVQADFWNGDPDIDAICRMEHAPNCTFDEKWFPMAGNKTSPFNSQNTFLSRKVMKDYFLAPGIGRCDDIWASFYVQALGHKVVYQKPSVVQERNAHDLTVDMEQELDGYRLNLKMLNDLSEDPERIWKYLPEQAKTCFELYRRNFE